MLWPVAWPVALCMKMTPKNAETHLVGHIKERQQVLALADVCNLAPLLLCRVNASGVVCTSCTKLTGIAE